MKTYVEVLKDTIPGISDEDLYMPFTEATIHNLDLIILRDSLENYFGFEIPDTDWHNLHTLYDALEYCRKKMPTPRETVADKKINTSRNYEVSMPKMANNALSENWLLKELGDMHWELLSKGLEQKSSQFADSQGNRLYAAFVRVRYAISKLSDFREGERLELESHINRHGNYSYFSAVSGKCGQKSIDAQLMTSFSARKANDNSQIAKSNPQERINHVPALDETPDFYTEHRLLKKGLISQVQSGDYTFDITDEEIDAIVHTINPHYEINGVGLVYFAVYPIIADMCASEFFRDTMEMTSYDSQYHTVHRDIFYYANCNADDKIVVKLNSAKLVNDNKIQITASLYRQSDNRLMARVLTVKQKKS